MFHLAYRFCQAPTFITFCSRPFIPLMSTNHRFPIKFEPPVPSHLVEVEDQMYRLHLAEFEADHLMLESAD
jgi:hypothetical protein